MTLNRNLTAKYTGQNIRRPGGFTLIELLVVAAIISLLAVGMVKIAQSVHVNAKIRNTESTIQILTSALQEYQSAQRATDKDPFPPSPYWFAWYDLNGPPDPDVDLPPANGYLDDAIDQLELVDKLGAISSDSYTYDDDSYFREARVSSELMYFYLNDMTASKKLLAKLPANVQVNIDQDEITLATGNQDTISLTEVVDSWDNPIRYRSDPAGNFPTLTSAGPDGLFDNADDIVSGRI